MPNSKLVAQASLPVLPVNYCRAAEISCLPCAGRNPSNQACLMQICEIRFIDISSYACRSWASPIVMTSVYVVATQDLNFAVQYPKLGINRSGFVQNGGKYEPNIASYTNVFAYAVDEGTGQLLNNGIPVPPTMRVWRVTYTNSNSTKDIMITVNPNHGTAFGTFLRKKGPGIALIIGILVAILFWILAWYFLAPRLVGKNKRIRGLWQMSLPYLGLNLVLFIPGGILLLFFYFGVKIIPLVHCQH